MIGKDKNQVFVIHGGEYYRVSPIDTQPVEQKMEENQNNELMMNAEWEAVEQEGDDYEDEYHAPPIQERENQEEKEDSEESVEPEGEMEDIDTEESAEVENHARNPTVVDGSMPANGSKIRYKFPNWDVCNEATVLGRAGKAGVRHQFWRNI